MHPIERELKTMRGFAACLHDENCLDEADKELARLLSVEAAARRALEAWDTTVLPKSHDGMMQERMECLRADLGAELFNTNGNRPAPEGEAR